MADGRDRSPSDRARTCCGGARRWPASPAPGSASPRASTSGSASRRCSPSPPTSGWPPCAATRRATLEPETLIDEWMKSVGEGVAGYVTPKVAVGAVVGNDEGRILLVQRADSGIWLYPTGWADVGYSASEVAVKEVHEETGIECEVVRLIAVLDGLRLGFTRMPLYSLVFHCRAIGGDLAAHPLETTDVGLFARGRAARAAGRLRAVGRPRVRRHPRRGAGRALRRTERQALAWLRSSGRRWPSWPSQVRRKERAAVEVVDQALAAIEAGNDALNAFVAVDAELARRAAADGRRRRRPRRGPGPARRRALRREGPRGLRRHADLPRLAAVQGRPAGGGGLDPGRPHAGRRRGADRQDGRARVRHAQLHQDEGVGHHPQPVGPGPHARWLERRVRGRGRRRARADRHRERRRRVDPHPGRLHRPRRAQGRLRAHPAPRPVRLADRGATGC